MEPSGKYILGAGLVQYASRTITPFSIRNLRFSAPLAAANSAASRWSPSMIKTRTIGSPAKVFADDEIKAITASIFTIGNNSVFLDAESKTMIASGHPKRLLEECENPTVHKFLTRGEASSQKTEEGERCFLSGSKEKNP
jgi:hypothetical protein